MPAIFRFNRYLFVISWYSSSYPPSVIILFPTVSLIVHALLQHCFLKPFFGCCIVPYYLFLFYEWLHINYIHFTAYFEAYFCTYMLPTHLLLSSVSYPFGVSSKFSIWLSKHNNIKANCLNILYKVFVRWLLKLKII